MEYFWNLLGKKVICIRFLSKKKRGKLPRIEQECYMFIKNPKQKVLLIWPPVRINLVDSLIGCLYLFVIRDPPHWWSQLVIFFKKPPRDTSHGICKIDTSSKISSSGGVNLVSKGSPGSGKRYYESNMVIQVVEFSREGYTILALFDNLPLKVN